MELISVDSVMVYKDCNIGSAKPTKDILKKYPHKMIDVVTPNEIFTVADFYNSSKKIIEKAHLNKKIPLFVGGTMMYFKLLQNGFHDMPKRDNEYRKNLEKIKSKNQKNFLYSMLKEIDPDYANKINMNDEVRIIRALEIFNSTGKLMTNIFSMKQNKLLKNKYDIHQFGLVEDRRRLHKNIEIRLNEILEKGFVKEAESLLSKYTIKDDHPLRKSINYKQMFSYLDGNSNLKTFFEKALYATRQLAKKQITWQRSWDIHTEIKESTISVFDNELEKIKSRL